MTRTTYSDALIPAVDVFTDCHHPSTRTNDRNSARMGTGPDRGPRLTHGVGGPQPPPVLPRAWCDDEARLQEAGIGEDIRFATKPARGLQMLARAIEGGMTAKWVTADEAYGRDSKVPQRFHGRVIALNQTLTWSTLPIGFLVLVPLSGKLQPLLDPGGALATTVGRVLGTGAGRGLGLAYVLCGLGMALVALRVRLLTRLDEDLPDAPPTT